MRRRDGRTIFAFVLVALLVGSGVIPLRAFRGWVDAVAQEQPPPPESPVPPDAVSLFITRTYKIKPKKLWKQLLATLTSAGYPPEEVDEGAQHVRTSFVDFNEKDFPEPVAGQPPEFTADYPILQLVRVVEGKVSLEAKVGPAQGGTSLSLRARLLVHGLDRRRHLRVMTDRRSSGTIEKTVMKKLEDDLGIKPI